MNYPANIFFSLEEGSDYTLFFHAWALTDKIIPQVKVNGVELKIKRLNADRFSCYEGKIPKELLDKQPVKISFYASKAVDYREIYPSHYNSNHPPLSFAVNRIQIVKEGF